MAAWTVAPAARATAAVLSVESESMTTSSSTSPVRSTRSARIPDTMPPMVGASSRAGMTTLTVVAPFASRRSAIGQSPERLVDRANQAAALLCTAPR